MSVEAIAIVLNHSRAKGAAKIVLMGIANHINPDNDGAWPSQAKLAGYANVSDRAVRDAVEVLVGLGELHYETAAGLSKTQYKPNRYWLTLSCPPECDGTTNHRIRAEVSDNRVEVFDNQGGSFRQSGWKQASDEPLIEPEEETVINTFVHSSNKRKEYDEQFSKFWEIYPRSSGKLKAEKAFLKALKVASFDVLISGAMKYRDDKNRVPSFTKEAATWLNAGCWDDEPLPPRIMSFGERRDEAEVISRKKSSASRVATEALLAESKAAEQRARKNPPKLCKHDRVAVMCKSCNNG